MKEEDKILAERKPGVTLPNLQVWEHKQRIAINNEEELESIFQAYQKLYAKAPFASIRLDLYWEERTEQ